MDCSPPGSSVHGISQARIVDWFAIYFSRGTAAEEGRLKEAGRAAQATGPGSGTVSVRTHASGAPTARKRTLWVLRAKGRRYPYREGTAQCVGPQLRLSPSLPCLALRPAEEHLKSTPPTLLLSPKIQVSLASAPDPSGWPFCKYPRAPSQ